MRNHEKMTRRNVYLPDVLYGRYERYAKTLGVGAAEVMRQALLEFIEKKEHGAGTKPTGG